MSFTCKHNDIPRLPVVNGIGDGFFPVTDFNIIPLGLIDAGFNILYNILGFLKPRIIGCDNGKVRIGSADFPHLKPPEHRAVSPTAKHTHQPLWLIFPQGSQKALKAHGIMGIINQQRKAI